MTQPNFLDVLSPSFVGSKVFVLSISEQTPMPAALRDVRIDIDYSGADRYGGVVLPIVVTIQAPSTKDYVSRTFRRAAPGSYVFTPKEVGRHLVVVRELFHNQLHGALEFDVVGESSVL